VRLLQPGNPSLGGLKVQAAATPTEPGHWLLVPRQHIFGSDELSALSPALAELVESGYIALRSADAAALGVSPGDGVVAGDALATLAVRVDDSLAEGCAAYPAGLAGTENLHPLDHVALRRAENWQRPPELIGSDGGARPRGARPRGARPRGATPGGGDV
jgi:hypothetical protein